METQPETRRSFIRDQFNKIGLFLEKPNEKDGKRKKLGPYELHHDIEKLKLHKEFLQSLDQWEIKRLEVIEGKTSQLFAQTSIIVSLLGLFVPILIDKFPVMLVGFQIAVLFFLICAFAFFMVAVHNILKNYHVARFPYSRPKSGNVLELQNRGINTFITDEIRDLLYCIPQNKDINDKKANHLIYAGTSFKAAIILTGCLVVTFTSSVFFFSDSTVLHGKCSIPMYRTRLVRTEALLMAFVSREKIAQPVYIPKADTGVKKPFTGH